MRKLILKYWITNVLFSLILFVIHRIVIAEKEYADDNWLDLLFNMIDILVNLGFSLIFLVLLPLCSLTFFLNLIDKIRNQFYLSLLTFIGIPTAVVIYILTAFIDLYSSGSAVFTTSLILSVIYLIFNYIQFRLFRKRVLLMTTGI